MVERPLVAFRRKNWPEDISTVPSTESVAEATKIKDVLGTAVSTPGSIDNIMDRFPFKKAIRITGWILRFKKNCTSNGRMSGPLTMEELYEANEMWIKRVQGEATKAPAFEQQLQQLNLRKNDKGIYLCAGCLQGDYPVYLPTDAVYTERLVMNAHLHILHGGVVLTITRIRERYWIPGLRQLAKRLIPNCFGCKQFHATPLRKPPQACLPTELTTGKQPFQIFGLDYARPLYYKRSGKAMGKAYILLLSCSLTCAICLELLPDQSLERFLPTLKKFIARRGRPEKIYSDNFSIFVAAAKWLKKVQRAESVHDFLSQDNIRWQFNLSRAPWWGGQFE